MWSSADLHFTRNQRMALRTLASRKPGGGLNLRAVSRLFEMGLVEIQGAERRPVLTGLGYMAVRSLGITRGP